MTKKIFIAATLQNVGKTTFCLGLIACLKRYFKRIGFIKPIGQRYLIEQGYKVDEDSVLIDRVYGVCCNLNVKDLSPIAVERGFTEKYIQGNAKVNYEDLIINSFNRIAKDNELVVIEGTGHAGVGSVFDLSNARVAELLGSKVILLAPGGVGRPIDEVILNKALFDRSNVEIAGVIVNKVMPDKFDKINKFVRMGFQKKNIPVLGVMPYLKRLGIPTIREIAEELGLDLLCGERCVDAPVDRILIGAMEVEYALKYVEDNSLVITPADRVDMLKAVITLQSKSSKEGARKISGIVLTGNTSLNPDIFDFLKNLQIPTIAIKSDTFKAAKMVDDIIVKIKPEDKEKINLTVEMVAEYVDIDRVLKHLM